MSREGKAPSQRQLRVGEALRHTLSEILTRGEVRDPEIAGVSVTVTEVRVSPDLKNATAFVSRLGGGNMTPVLAALSRATPFLRHEIGKDVRLRFTPRLTFAADRSFDQASHIDDLLRSPEVRRDLDTGAPQED